jgi:hypothetical protein
MRLHIIIIIIIINSFSWIFSHFPARVLEWSTSVMRLQIIVINNYFSWIFSHLPAILVEWFIPVIPLHIIIIIIIIIINVFLINIDFDSFVCFLFPVCTSAVFVSGH